MQNIINGKLAIIPGIRQLATFLSAHATSRGVLRGFAGSINARICVTIAALTSLVALFVPWVILDGHANPLSGAGLMTYALQGNDRWVMWQISPVGHRSDADGPPSASRLTVCWDGVHRPAAELSSGCAAVHPRRHPGAAEIHAADPRRTNVHSGQFRGARSRAVHPADGDPGGDRHQLRRRASTLTPCRLNRGHCQTHTLNAQAEVNYAEWRIRLLRNLLVQPEKPWPARIYTREQP